MKINNILVILLPIMLLGILYVIMKKNEKEKEKKNEKENEMVMEDGDVGEDSEMISKHFIKMFRDVAPWPGISQASYKPKTENEKIN